MKVLIFDLDDTLTSNCFYNNPEKKKLILDILKHANKCNYRIYIVTARTTDPDINPGGVLSPRELFTYNIDNDIIKQIAINTTKTINSTADKNLLYNFEDDEMRHAITFIRSKVKNANLLYYMERNLTSLLKFYQIQKIMSKVYNKDVPPENFYFFDDARYHLRMYNLWGQLINKKIRKLNFIGGQGNCVFDDYTREYFENENLL